MDGEPPQEEDFSQIPIIERSQHKNWKARLSAYNDVIAKSAKTASDTDPFFRPYVSDGPLLRKWCLDANAVAQEKGIEAVLAIAQYSGESSAKTRIDVVPGLVDKALGSARAGTRKKGAELCAMYVEVENGGEGVVNEVLVGLDSKQPKVVAGSISCLKEIVEQFGVPALGNIKPMLKYMTKIFAHTDKNVRAEGSSLVLALYPYLGPALLPALSDLKPVQMAELQKSFDALEAEGRGVGKAKPTRFTRKAQRDQESAGATDGDDDGGAQDVAEPAPIDPRDLLDPVNVLGLFPTDLDERLSSSKWKDRLEVLEECTKVLAEPRNARISDSNVDAYSSLVATLGTKCKSDANINVVIEAARVIEGLSKGLGKSFGRFKSVIMNGCLERLKERKANVTDALGKALDAIFSTVSFNDIVEDIVPQMKSKNPQVREGTLKFLHRSLQTTPDAPGKDHIKPLAESLVSLLGDSVEPVRSNAAECLGTMMKILGERAFNPYIEGVGEIQMTKVKEAFAKAEIQYRPGGGAKANAAKPAVGGKPPAARKPAPKPAAPSSPPIKASGKFNTDDLLDDFSAPPAKPPPARFARPGAPKPAAASVASSPAPKAPAARPAVTVTKPAPPAAAAAPKPSAPAKTGGPAKTLAVSPNEPVKFKYSSDDALARAADVIPAAYHTKLADPAWKVRLEAADEMIAWVSEGAAESVDSEIMFRFLGKTPGWNEKNFQVSAKIYQVMSIMAEKSPLFGKPSVALAAGPLSDKLGDMKLKKPAGDALATFAEKTSLAFVLAQAYESMQKQKAVKAQADALLWIKQQLIDFGIAGIPLRDLIAFVKTGLQSPNAAVRSSATQVLVTVRIFVGADISGFLEDLNPQLLSTINSEFDKVSGQAPPEPTKTSADLRDAAPAGGKGKGATGGSDPLDDLIPRVDLDKLVNQTSVLNDSRADAWKVRKEAFEALNALLEVKANSRLKPNMGDIANVLKKAMGDTNLSVKMLALGIVSKIAAGMGQPFEKYTRLLTPAVAGVCADQKATTRNAGVTCLNSMADACGSMDSMFSGLGAALESPNPALRGSVLGWMADRLKVEPPSPGADMSGLAAPVLSCLEDRNGDVRKGAGAVLPFVVQFAGYDFVMDQTSKLKPASKATIVPLIQSAKASAPASSVPSAAPAKTATGPVKTPGTGPGRKVAAASARAPDSPKPAPAARSIQVPGRSLAMKALAPTARPLAQEDRPLGIPKPRAFVRPVSATLQSTAASSTTARQPPFVSAAPEARAARLKRDANRWILESGNKDLPEYLSAQMEPNTSPELFALLFSKDHRAEEDYMAALTAMTEFYDRSAPTTFSLNEDELLSIQLANVDLALKYGALRLMSNNTQMANRSLELLTRIIESMQSSNARFSDTEAKLFVPALVMKLGDPKFVSRLSPIFEMLDKVLAASQVVQLLITYGLDDKSGKTCKNESLGLIEKTYKKRGSILRTRDDRGFYEVLAKCISDSGTRNAALSVLALLQLQGGSASLNAVVDAMPASSRDMLANRKATMAASKGFGAPAPAAPAAAGAGTVPRIAEVVVEGTPGRIPRSGFNSPRIAGENGARGSSSPARGGIFRPVGSPVSRGATSGSSSPASSRISAPSAATRAIPAASAALGRIQRPAESINGNGRSLQPLARPSILLPPVPSFRVKENDPIIALINDVRQDDLSRSVEALKQLQLQFDMDANVFTDSVQTLADTLLDKLDWAFTPPENLEDLGYFRLVKHIIQTFNGFTSNQDLMRRLTYDDIYALIYGLSLHLIQADRMGGRIQELVQFKNMILIHTLATPDRYIVFKAMFQLLLNLTKDFSVNQVQPEAEIAAHADLVIKCLWKRCKILDDDFASGRLAPGALLGIVEDFVRGVPPSEYRKREKMGVALGDMPLRTIKTIIQKVLTYARNNGVDIYDILRGEFGEGASDAIVYSYIFRLAGDDVPRARPASARSTSPIRPTSAASLKTSSSHLSHSERERAKTGTSIPAGAGAGATVPVSSSSSGEQSEVVRLVRNLRIGKQGDRIDELYAYIKGDSQREDNVEQTLVKVMGPTVATFVKRALEQRKSQEQPSPARYTITPAKVSLPDSLSVPRTGPRKSLGPRPSSIATVDKNAPVDTQLAQYKNVFEKSVQYMAGSQSPESKGGVLHHSWSTRPYAGDGGVGGGGDRGALNEISLQGKGRSPLSSDVD